MRLNREHHIPVAVTLALDSTTAEVLPVAVEAGLNDPHEFEEIRVIYGWVEHKRNMGQIRDIAGVIAVQRQISMRQASDDL